MLNLLDKTMWCYVMKDIGVELQFTPYAVFWGILAYFVIKSVFMSKNKKNHGFIKILFLIYFLALIRITLLEREAGTRTGVSLTLFETIGDSRSNAYVIENILLFIPFGFLTAVFIGPMRNIIISMGAGALCSLAIETVQLITQRGHFQVDDIWTNSIGAGTGCICCCIFALLCRRFRRNHKDG